MVLVQSFYSEVRYVNRSCQQKGTLALPSY